MNIPDSIVEQAASESFGPDWNNAHTEDQRHHRNEARKILNAVAPQIAAQVLRNSADRIATGQFGPAAAPYVSAIKSQIRADADHLDPQ